MWPSPSFRQDLKSSSRLKKSSSKATASAVAADAARIGAAGEREQLRARLNNEPAESRRRFDLAGLEADCTALPSAVRSAGIAQQSPNHDFQLFEFFDLGRVIRALNVPDTIDDDEPR